MSVRPPLVSSPSSPDLLEPVAEEIPVAVAPERPTFDQVYERHFLFVWRVLRTLDLRPGVLEDAAQDVFVVVLRRLPEFDGRSDIRTWLFRVATLVASTERRRTRRKPEHEHVDEALPDSKDGPFEAFVRSEAIATLERVLERMDPDKRMLFVLMEIEQMTAAAVAELLEINVNTAYSRLRLAREQFRKLLDQDTQDPRERNP